MGTPNDFEIVLGDDVVELVTDECQSSEQVNSALMALMPTWPVPQQLPTPPSSPSPQLQQHEPLQVQYQGPKSFQHSELSCHSTGTNMTYVDQAFTKSSRNGLKLILAQSSVVPEQTIPNENVKASPLLNSKRTTASSSGSHTLSTTTSEHQRLVDVGSIASPNPRRLINSSQVGQSFDTQAKHLYDSRSEPSERTQTSGVKRSSPPDNEQTTVRSIQAQQPSSPDTSSGQDHHSHKRRRIRNSWC